MGTEDSGWLLDLIVSFGPAFLAAIIAIFVAAYQANKSLRAYFKQRHIERLTLSLNELYDPILALLRENESLFSGVGPPSFPEEHSRRESASKVWSAVKPYVLENNLRVREVLLSRSGLIHNTDNLLAYQSLLVHITMFNSTQNIPTDIMEKYRFPKDVRKHLEEIRSAVIQEIASGVTN